MEVTIKDGYITIKEKINKAPLPVSKSEKSRLLATSGGNIQAGIKHDGEDVVVGFTAYVKGKTKA